MKESLHPRNLHREAYNLEALISYEPQLEKYIFTTPNAKKTVRFEEPQAVRLLNKALLKFSYPIDYWEFPESNLCPPIPGRVDYIHYLADLLAESNDKQVPCGEKIKGWDIGTGATCIYPLLGNSVYGWSFIGSDIDRQSLDSSQNILNNNKLLQGKIELRWQQNPLHFLKGCLGETEKIHFTVCNPPFHSSLDEAQKGTARKVKNLGGKNSKLNFSGQTNELVYKGGEFVFIQNLIFESAQFAQQCMWFTILVSKEANLKGLLKYLEKNKVTDYKIISLQTGNKIARILAWTYTTTPDRNLANFY